MGAFPLHIPPLGSLTKSHFAVIQKLYISQFSKQKWYAHLWNPNLKEIKASQGNMTLGENYYYGGLLRFDLSPKPAYYKIKELLQEKWHTEAGVIADEKGESSFRGFYGDYEIEIETESGTETKNITLSKNSENKFTFSI